MRFSEGCRVLAIDSEVKSKSFEDYVSELFKLSKSVPLYVATAPALIATRIEGVLRKIVVAPGSAIVCSEDFDRGVVMEESTWIDAELLIPYTTRVVEGVKKVLPEVDADSLGIDYYEVPRENLAKLLDVVQGGFAVLSCSDWREVEGVLAIDDMTSFVSLVLRVVNPKLSWSSIRARVCIELGDLPPKVRVFAQSIASVGGTTVALQIGRGIAVNTPIDELSSELKNLVLALLLDAHTVDPSSPRARAYLARLAGHHL